MSNLSAIQPGQRIGPYVVEAHIASGGMGGVYRARHKSIERVAAIKTLLPHLAGDEMLVERLKREAKAIAALRHPNIVEIYDAQFDEEPAYIAMAYLAGGSLQRHLADLKSRGERMPVALAVEAARQIAAGLTCAHASGVVHRDIKPSNILLDGVGRYVVTDFGIALRGAGETRLTQDMAALGTPDYTSPEQAHGKLIDQRTDIYSLGALLYELLAGHPPFSADTPWAVINKHVTEPAPDVRGARPDTPAHVADAIQRAMAKAPDDRFASCDAFIAALDAPSRATVAVSSPPTAVAATRPANTALVFGAAALVTALVAAIAVAVMVMRDDASPAQAPTAAPTIAVAAATAAPTPAPIAEPSIDATATLLPAIAAVTPVPAATLAQSASTAEPARAGVDSQAVYSDGLVNGWMDWSWGETKRDLISQLVPARTGRSVVRASFGLQYDGLQFGRVDALPLGNITAIRLWVRGGGDGPVSVQIELGNDKDVFARTDTIVIDGDAWREVTIPIKTPDKQLGQIKFIGVEPDVKRAFYVDDISLVSRELAAPSNCPGAGGATRDVWFEVKGAQVKDVPVARAPAASDIVPELASARAGENFGERIRGFLCPPTDGEYVFFIASDDHGQFSLSTDESPANLVALARTTTWTGTKQWDKQASQQSKPVTLQAGRRYYFEVLHKQGMQGSHVEVGWRVPGGVDQVEIVPGRVLAPG